MQWHALGAGDASGAASLEAVAWDFFFSLFGGGG